MTVQEKEPYSLEFIVRDYECDLQGVVNNANYQHYLEHARHEYLISRGISFVQLHDEGIDLIVTKVEIEYKFPLRSRDKFIVTVSIQREGNVTGVVTRKGRPVPPGDLIHRLGLE
jgi:acyl-CoA thioester hydrolase